MYQTIRSLFHMCICFCFFYNNKKVQLPTWNGLARKGLYHMMLLNMFWSFSYILDGSSMPKKKQFKLQKSNFGEVFKISSHTQLNSTYITEYSIHKQFFKCWTLFIIFNNDYCVLSPLNIIVAVIVILIEFALEGGDCSLIKCWMKIISAELNPI